MNLEELKVLATEGVQLHGVGMPERTICDALLKLLPVVEAAEEWSGERSVRDWGDADLLKALWTMNGDRAAPCDGCDGECGEPCAPCTVAAAHAGIDRELERLVQAGKLHRGESLEICGNCDTAMPTGCGGIFKDDGEHCRLNLGPNVRVEAGPAAKPQARTMENSASPLCGPGVSMLGLASNEGLGLWHRSGESDGTLQDLQALDARRPN